MQSFTLLQKPTSTDRSPSRTYSFRPMSLEPLLFLKSREHILMRIDMSAEKPFDSFMSPQMKSTVRLAKRDCLRRPRPTIQVPLTLQQRPRPTTLQGLGTALMVCPSSSRIAQIIMDPINFLKSL